MGAAGGGESTDFTVTMTKKEVVAAVLPLQEHWLPLSNLDLLLPPLDFGVFFCYANPSTASLSQSTMMSGFGFGTMVSSLKAALARTLISYYAFAGEVVPNSMGEPELLCNNRGVDFLEAFADVELRHLNLYNPDETVEDKLVPKKKKGVLTVQATELKCGGIVVACTIDHRIADAYSANMFLVSWADMASSSPFTSAAIPSFRRSLLNPRHPPPYIDPSFDRLYIPISQLPAKKGDDEEVVEDRLISRIYYVTAAELSGLQKEASSDGHMRSKLESFSAFLWKMVALSSVAAAYAGGHDDGNSITTMTRMGIVVDGRCRLMGGTTDNGLHPSNNNDDHSTPGPHNDMGAYFGNVLSIPYGEKSATEMAEKALSQVAEAVHQFVEGAATEEHFRGLIDWVETHRPVPAVAKIYCKCEGTVSLVVSSGQRFPVRKMDFGWGKPVLGSYHFPWGGEAGYVMPMPSPLGNGDWVVYLHLRSSHLAFIESHAAHFFRPLSPDYLRLRTAA